ncbi:winged helix DNA-binding domain-containing protein [Arthrobacter dokdonensis]|uniref:winged helix DNA-binding domain-containing protein n=1 Tax=Arthrobacter dokdonellae TaxID=2211210 RepID=UPI000DE57FE3|nr:winged helix DNA-binding domain-containing protein [Arthrobacter dokdonellae]
MAPSVTPAVLARLRLAAQWILPASTRPSPGPVDVVRWLTALQGQDLPGALWSIGLRASGTGRAGVEAAFNRGEIVRSWPLRGTLHVTAAEDLGWILSLTSGRMLGSMAGRHRQLGITTPDLNQVRDVALALLEPPGREAGTRSKGGAGVTASPGASAGPDGGSCGRATREELLGAFEAAGQRTAAQRGIHLLWLLCVEGSLVQGPMNAAAGNGNTQFFVQADHWIKDRRVLERGEALAELALRYFRSHGPATIKDFQWWSKLTLADIKAGLDQVAGGLESVECGGTSYLLAPETAELLGGTLPGARTILLLPGFDEYLLGYTDRSAALAPHHAPLTVPGNNGMFKAPVVAGGRVAGTWRKAQGAAEKQREVAGVVLPELFDGLSPAQDRALERSAANYANFLAT